MILRLWIGFKILLCYLIPFFPCCPKIGRPEEGDCIFVQSFGRNSIPDEDSGKVMRKILFENKTLSDAFMLLHYFRFDPGKANMALAKKAVRLATKYKIPVIAQWEVIYYIWKSKPEWFYGNVTRIDCLWPPESGYFSTRDVKMESLKKMRERNKNRPIELCHPAMASRAVPIIWKLGIDVIVEGVGLWNFSRNELWVWDKDSLQFWTKDFKQWLPREILTRAHHLFHWWISFITPF